MLADTKEQAHDYIKRGSAGCCFDTFCPKHLQDLGAHIHLHDLAIRSKCLSVGSEMSGRAPSFLVLVPP